MSLIISGKDKGYWGKQWSPDVRRKSGPIVGFAMGGESNESRVKFKEFGCVEQFEGGTDEVGEVKSNNKPRYFVFGEPICRVREQVAIIDKLIGASNMLSNDVQKWCQANFMKFYNCNTNDGQYSQLDSLAVMSKHFDDIFRNYYDGRAYGVMVSPRCNAFDACDLLRMEGIMRLMMVATIPCLGGINIVNDNLVPNRNTRETRSNTNLDTSQPHTEPWQRATTSIAAVSTALTTPPNGTTPTLGILTPKVLFQIGNNGGAIQLKYLDPIEGGAVNWKKVQELVSIELMFDLHYSKKWRINS